MGMVQICHFEFLCQSMSIEPLVDRFWVFYQLHCSLGFYSFMQHSLVKKTLLTPPKSFHEWKSKFFFIKSGVILVKTDFRGVEEIPPETLEAPVIEIWYQDIKKIPSIELPKRALVAAKMSLFWKADRHDKPVYVEDKTTVKQPKVEPRDIVDIPESNPDDPIDVESSPETLVRTRAVKRKKPEGGAATQPVKKITRRNISEKGNLEAFATKLSQENLVHPLKRKHYQLLMMIASRPPPLSVLKKTWSVQRLCKRRWR
ncbi:hypothetical protein HanOQP8_Chr00c003g0684191 [Helianthus annuus]|nr:hypothetical protein HanOQP8_Chr00c003g0684191 [Helianthus annuus]